MSKMTKVSVSLQASTLKRVDQVSKKNGTSRSALIDSLLLDALDEAEALTKVMSDQHVMKVMMQAMTQPGVMRAITASLSMELDDKQKQSVLDFFKLKGGPPAVE